MMQLSLSAAELAGITQARDSRGATGETIRGIASEVEIGPEDGMPDHCVLSLDNLRVLPKSYFVDRICTLGPEQMDRVCRALSIATGCS